MPSRRHDAKIVPALDREFFFDNLVGQKMHPGTDHLEKLLIHAGWLIVRKDEPDAWWADECWHLAAAGGSVVITLLVDPQADMHRRKKGEAIWAAKASAGLPSKWQREEDELVLDFGKHWRDRATPFVESLDQFLKKKPKKPPQQQRP